MVRYGIDPAHALASFVSDRTGIPVVRGIAGPPWWPGRAGTDRASRGPVAFTVRAAIPQGAVLVDDVLTTGATIESAIAACGPVVVGVVTATTAVGGIRGSPGRGC
jgi:adenine/guanine phosphoribosyltransferase-like PRPP-binding protein